jgi:hypothetical protein
MSRYENHIEIILATKKGIFQDMYQLWIPLHYLACVKPRILQRCFP